MSAGSPSSAPDLEGVHRSGPGRQAGPDRARDHALPGRCFAFDQFGPLPVRPAHGASWAQRKRPARLPATYHRTHGIRYFHGCYCLAMTSCGASCEPARAPITPWPR
jgi:hypothetical protein